MKQIKVGTFQLGFENVDLYARSETGGEFYCVPDKNSPARIKVGVEYNQFSSILSVLIHELFEMSSERHGLRFEKTTKFNDDSANFVFVMDHTQFGHSCSEVAHFLDESLVPLAKVWKSWNKPMKARKKALDKKRRR